MVFLFIAFLGIICLFCIPFRLSFTCFIEENTQKPAFSLFIAGKQFNFTKTKVNHLLKQIQKSNDFGSFVNDAFTLSSSGIREHVSRIVLEKAVLEIVIPNNSYAPISYPLIGCLQYADSVFFDTLRVNVAFGDRFYFQCRATILLNLHLIFSVFLQIIKPKGGK